MGKIPILTHILQRGWFNHHLVIELPRSMVSMSRCSEDYPASSSKAVLLDLTKACYPNMPQNLSTIDLPMLGDPQEGMENVSGSNFNESRPRGHKEMHGNSRVCV